ncbi:hypothetical protein AB0J80_13425 [Actinoplanes sp. NPDC049548]|uniref:hypothetical protein n=1 Tax=Actinoplanes sp. NPDC049548 TaxID=3155152 RepID=UPI003437A458
MTEGDSDRAIPLQSIKGENDAATEILRELFYLVEIERQAKIFNESFQSAVDAALQGENSLSWRHMQSAMFAGIIVSRLVTYGQDPRGEGWPGSSKADKRRKAKEAKVRRVKSLRVRLELPQDNEEYVIYAVSKVRNSLEHIDEWLDLAVSGLSDVAALSDWYLAGRSLVLSPEDPNREGAIAGMRGFSPEAGVAIFHRDRFDLFFMDIEMAKMYHNAREVQHDLLRELRGRCQFGGGQVRIFSDELRERHRWWSEKRSEILAEQSPDPAVDGRVRLWMKVGGTEPGRNPAGAAEASGGQ